MSLSALASVNNYFGGSFQPVDNQPVLNHVNVGQSVPPGRIPAQLVLTLKDGSSHRANFTFK